MLKEKYHAVKIAFSSKRNLLKGFFFSTPFSARLFAHAFSRTPFCSSTYFLGTNLFHTYNTFKSNKLHQHFQMYKRKQLFEIFLYIKKCLGSNYSRYSLLEHLAASTNKVIRKCISSYILILKYGKQSNKIDNLAYNMQDSIRVCNWLKNNLFYF